MSLSKTIFPLVISPPLCANLTFGETLKSFPLKSVKTSTQYSCPSTNSCIIGLGTYEEKNCNSFSLLILKLLILELPSNGFINNGNL